MANLPYELIFEILHYLPVKSLLRFKSVSKPFYDTINSRNLINSHFKTYSENRILLLNYSGNHPSDIVNHFAHCNGLVLLLDYDLVVWNPSTKKQRIVSTDLYVRKTKKNIDGGEFYWTKLFRITFDEISCIPFGSDISYLGFSEEGDDDQIFVLYDKYVLRSYDFKAKRTKRILFGDTQKQNVIFYNKSLVDPFDYEQGIMRILDDDQQVPSIDCVDYNMEDAKEEIEMITIEMEEQEEIRSSEFDAVEEQAFKFMEKFDSMAF